MSLFARLLLLLILLPALSLAVVFGMLWKNAGRLERNLEAENRAAGRRASEKGTRLLEADLKNTQARVIREKAKRLETFFADIAGSAQLEATLCAQFLADQGDTGQAPPLYTADEVIRLVRNDPKFRDAVWSRQPYVLYHLAPGVLLGSVEEPLARLRRLGGFFAHSQQALAGCDSLYFGDARGFILGYPGGGDPFAPSYDPRLRPWYLPARERGQLVWLVDKDKNGVARLVTCAQLVNSSVGEPLGVAAVDVRVTDVMAELFNVGSLKVSRAVLLDEQDRVRVSAHYDAAAGGQLVYDKPTLQDAPPVAQFGEPGFARAAEQVRRHGSPTTYSTTSSADDPRDDADAGVFWEGRGMADSEHVYVSAPVRLRTTMAGPSNEQWQYIVQLPLAPLAAPVRAVAGEIDSSTREISAAIQSEARKSALALVGVIAATLALALLAAWLAARRTSRPLVEMARVARGVGGGDLSCEAVEQSGGEIGDLERALNGMIRGLRQRDLLRQTFGRYVAPGVVDQVLSQGNARLGGVKRKVTIFFSDLKGFTSLSERTDPESLVLLLNEYFDAMTRVILESEGTLDKYIGDAILAFWGDPVAHDDDAVRACRAALEQYRRLQSLWTTWDARGLPRLDMRIGIETGQAVVGNVGSELKLNYTVLGDAVNFASRLEGVNKVYGTRVLIGEATRCEAGGAIEARELDLLTVVGKTKPVRVYELLGMAGEVGAPRRDGYQAYERALAAYRERRWADAEAEARAAERILGSDEPTRALLMRIASFSRAAPPAGWDGSLVLDHK